MPAPVTGAAFWRLMDQWHIPDRQALALIDHPPGATGRRPRFALTTEQAGRLHLLREIGAAAAGLHGDPGAWLRKPNPAAPFRRRPPVDLMAQDGPAGMHRVLQALQRAALAASVAATGRARRAAQP